ncbi:hypothetical protein LHJ74_06395 [Streptomyces sp. N2-109]|uniref:Lipoprotein n=1 Tax=Streptomyces gossypii TaxID=2883101 RepID=A0ABT2JP92_9ACTN|nr:hypothetical protein [Streptomyces gossypii]MCT2589556.1 hypothetical protein [Streptomyces gossypii]
MLRNTTVLSRTAVLAATAVLALTACGSGDGGSGKKDRRNGGDASSAAGDGKPQKLSMGETADKPTEVTSDNRTGKFEVAAKKVVLGKPGDLSEASSDPKKFTGQVPAWLYVEYTHVGGDSPADASTATDWGITTTGGVRGRPLMMLMGDLPSTPDDCRDADTVGAFKKGQTETLCQVYVVPEKMKIEEAQLNRGFHSPPTTWTMK